MPVPRSEILLAVADPWLREALAGALRAESLRPREAGDGYSAWAEFLAVRGALDGVVADLDLPGLAGAALVRRLRRERPALPALLLANDLSPRLRARLAEEGIASARLPAPLAQLALRFALARRGARVPVARELRAAG